MRDSEKTGSLATERQKEYARQLGIVFSEQISRAEIGKLIDEAVISRDEKRYQELDELEQRESDAWERMRTEVLAEIDADPEDCRLSKAGTSQIVEELSRRGLAAVLITMPWDDFFRVSWAGVAFTTSFSDDILLEDAEEIIKAIALTYWKRDGNDPIALVEKASALIAESSQLVEAVLERQKS